MITNSNHEKAVISASMETTEAKVKMSPELMNLLSNSIYTDKILAVIREISCNALDAHRAAGNEEPISVHLPTTWEQWFSVTDYGIGLSHKDVMTMYLTYGESQKQHTNELIGGFGIGSKSPFAYTDAFTVESIFEGVKRIYSIYKSSGIPNCTILSESNTTERNGLTVKVPVQQRDIYDFRTKASKVFKAFDTKPLVNIDITMELNTAEEFDTYFTVEENYSNGRFFAKVGDVIYGIEHDSTAEFFELVGYKYSYYLKLPIGSVAIAGSREKLSMDEQTKDYIKEVIEGMKQEVFDKMVDEVEQAVSIFEFRDLVEDSVDSVKNKALYEGKTLEEWKQQFDITLPEAVEYFDKGWDGTKRYKTTEGEVFNPIRKKGTRKVFLKDTKVGGITEFKQEMSYGGRGKVAPMFECEIKMNEFIKLMMWDGCDIIRSSELRKHKPKRKPKATAQIEVLRKRKDGRIVRYTIPEFDTNSIEKPVLFVETQRNYWIDPEKLCIGNNGKETPVLHSFGEIKDAMNLGLINDTVFLIRSATVRRLTNPRSKVYNENFKRYNPKSVWDVPLTETERKEYVIKVIKDRVKVHHSIRNMFEGTGLFTCKEDRLLSISSGREAKSDIINRLQTIAANGTGNNNHFKILNRIDVSVKDFSEGLYSRISERYPFMKMVLKNSYYNGSYLDVPEGSEVYLKHLISETDKGTFKENE